MRPITARFKDSWKVAAKVTTTGRDQWGDPLPGTGARIVEDCLFSPTSSTEGTDLSDVPDDRAKLLAPPGTVIASTATIEVPGFGTYAVEGTPNVWPLGTSVQLRRTGGLDGRP